MSIMEKLFGHTKQVHKETLSNITVLEQDLLDSHQAVETFRLEGYAEDGHAIDSRCRKLHWMLDQIQHLSSHPRSMIKRVAVESFDSSKVELLVWQDTESWMCTQSIRRLTFQLMNNGVTNYIQQADGEANSSRLNYPQQEFDLLHWVSRNEGDMNGQ